MRNIILQWSFEVRMYYQNFEMQLEQFSNHCRKKREQKITQQVKMKQATNQNTKPTQSTSGKRGKKCAAYIARVTCAKRGKSFVRF